MAKNTRIAIILPRGETLRNFVYSGCISEIARKVDIYLLTIIPNQQIFQKLSEYCDGIFALSEHREKWPVRITREILDLAHGRWLWSEAAKERWRLRDHEARSSSRRLKRVGKKFLCLPFANRSGLELLSGVERKLSLALRTTDQYIDYFSQLRPALVFNTSHVHSRNAIQAVQAAQWLGIPTAAFIFSWDNLTSQGRIIPPYDHYLVWNENLKQQLLDIYPAVKSEQVFVTGTPQFDFHFQEKYYWPREQFCEKVGADPSRPIILYSTGMPNHMPGEPEIVEEIADRLKEMHDLGPPQLLVRVYPKDRSGRFDALHGRRPDILFPQVPWEPAWLTPKPEDIPLLTNTLRHADCGINVASTVSLELCMFDKPVINVGYNPPSVPIDDVDYSRYYDFDHYRPVVASGAVRVAADPSELQSLIVETLISPAWKRQKRKRLLNDFFGSTLDGQTWKRIADILMDLSREHHQE